MKNDAAKFHLYLIMLHRQILISNELHLHSFPFSAYFEFNSDPF